MDIAILLIVHSSGSFVPIYAMLSYTARSFDLFRLYQHERTLTNLQLDSMACYSFFNECGELVEYSTWYDSK